MELRQNLSKETSPVVSEVHSVREGSFLRHWRATWMAKIVGTLVKRETTLKETKQVKRNGREPSLSCLNFTPVSYTLKKARVPSQNGENFEQSLVTKNPHYSSMDRPTENQPLHMNTMPDTLSLVYSTIGCLQCLQTPFTFTNHCPLLHCLLKHENSTGRAL